MRSSDWISAVCSSDLSLACGSWLWLGGGPGRSRLGNANRLARLYLLKAADNNPVPRPQALLYHPVAALHRAERDLARFGHVLGANHHPGATLRTDGPRALRNEDAEIGRASCRERGCQYV